MVQRSLDLTVDELYVKWLTDQANQSSFSRIWQQGAIWLILLTGFVAVIVIFVGLAKNKPEKGFLN